MEISPEGIKFICSFEGFRAFPYQDVKGVWTIGYGTTVYPNGLKVTSTDMAVTESQAMDCLKYHIDKRVVPSLIRLVQDVGLGRNQLDALCSIVYNIGAKAFDNSTLKKDIINGALPNIITADFMMWVKSGGQLVKGLVTRRKAEAELFLS
jgi:lysozyme